MCRPIQTKGGELIRIQDPSEDALGTSPKSAVQLALIALFRNKLETVQVRLGPGANVFEHVKVSMGRVLKSSAGVRV